MTQLPEKWGRTSIGDLNQFSSRTIDPSKSPSQWFELYSVPSSATGNPEVVQGSKIGSTKISVAPGDVLVCKINPRINRVWSVANSGKHPQIASSEWVVVRAPQVDSRYLKHYFSSPKFRELICQDLTGVGGSLTRAQPKRVATFPVPLAPSNEQIRIADKLDTVLARVDAVNDRLARVAPILKRFRQSVLAAATSGRLTEEWREQHSTLPPTRRVSLSEVASEFSYGSSAKSAKTGSIPVLRMGNIQDGRLDWSDLVFTSDQDEIQKYRLTSGDVLFNRTNSPELVGKTAVFTGEREAIYAGYLIRVRCLAELHPFYLNYCLGSPAGRNYCWQVKSDGVSQSNINAQKLRAFEFDLPDMSEQTEIIRRVERLFAYADRIEARLQAAQAAAGRLTPALLAKAFRGELVPQDPNDEPATDLLRRLKEDRLGAKAAAKKDLKS